MLPDFLGLINLSMWDKLHQKKRLQKLLKVEDNDACEVMLHHLQVDDIVEGHIHHKDGVLFPIRKEIERDLKHNFGVEGKFSEELAEFIIELSLDQILEERKNFIQVFQKELQQLEIQSTAEKLRKIMGKRKRSVAKYLQELKCLNPYHMLTIDGVLMIARRRYGFNLKSILELSKRIKVRSVRGALKNAKIVHKLMKDQVYIAKLKDIQEKHKISLEKKFDNIIKEVKNGNYPGS